MSPKGQIAEHKQQITMLLEKEYVEKIDKVAKKLRISRNQLLRNIILNGCEDIGILDKTGLFSVIGFMRDVKDRLKAEKQKGSA